MTFILTVSQEDLMIISEGLGNLSFKMSAVLISKLQEQVNEQLKPEVKEITKK